MIIFSSVEDTRQCDLCTNTCACMCVHSKDCMTFLSLYIQCISARSRCAEARHLDKQDCCAQPIQVNKRTSHPTPSFCFHSIHKRLPPARWRFQPRWETHLCYLCFGLVLRLLASFTARVSPAEN